MVVKESLHHCLRPSLTAFDLWFTTLGGKYLWPDFHRLAVRHARHTIKGIRHRDAWYYISCLRQLTILTVSAERTTYLKTYHSVLQVMIQVSLTRCLLIRFLNNAVNILFINVWVVIPVHQLGCRTMYLPVIRTDSAVTFEAAALFCL